MAEHTLNPHDFEGYSRVLARKVAGSILDFTYRRTPLGIVAFHPDQIEQNPDSVVTVIRNASDPGAEAEELSLLRLVNTGGFYAYDYPEFEGPNRNALRQAFNSLVAMEMELILTEPEDTMVAVEAGIVGGADG